MDAKVSAKNSYRWIIHAVYLCLIALTWWLNSSVSEMRRLGVEYRIKDASFLVDQYMHHRNETGEWLEASKAYGAYFHLKSSIESENGRLDTFVSEPGMRLTLRLLNNGEITFDVDFNKQSEH